MKETKIAKQSIKDYKENEVGILDKDYPKTLGLKFICLTHKQTCQRLLEFLERDMLDFMNINGTCYRIINNKITDLKQAIKLYDNAGI